MKGPAIAFDCNAEQVKSAQLTEELSELSVEVVKSFEKLLRIDPNSIVTMRTVEGVVLLEPSDFFLRLVTAARVRDVDLLLREIESHLHSSMVGVNNPMVDHAGSEVESFRPGNGGAQ